MLRITVLMENSPSANKALINEHGLSLILDADEYRLLFDCGSGAHFMHNAHKLGINLTALDGIILSHSHYDHAAGFRDFVEVGYRSPALYVGKGFFDRKFSKKGSVYTDLSAGWDESFASAHGFKVHMVSGTMEIAPGISIHQGFPRTHEEETIPNRFVKETGRGFVPDDFSDEIALSIKTTEGLVVIAGCAHPGIMNMIDEIQKRTGERIYAVIGGTHLTEADEERTRRSIQALDSTGAEIIGLCHCSGLNAEEMAREVLGGRASSIVPGDTIVIR